MPHSIDSRSLGNVVYTHLMILCSIATPVDSLLLELRLQRCLSLSKLVYSESESWSVLGVYIRWSYLGSPSSLGYLHMRTVQRLTCKET